MAVIVITVFNCNMLTLFVLALDGYKVNNNNNHMRIGTVKIKMCPLLASACCLEVDLYYKNSSLV